MYAHVTDCRCALRSYITTVDYTYTRVVCLRLLRCAFGCCARATVVWLRCYPLLRLIYVVDLRLFVVTTVAVDLVCPVCPVCARVRYTVPRTPFCWLPAGWRITHARILLVYVTRYGYVRLRPGLPRSALVTLVCGCRVWTFCRARATHGWLVTLRCPVVAVGYVAVVTQVDFVCCYVYV